MIKNAAIGFVLFGVGGVLVLCVMALWLILITFAEPEYWPIYGAIPLSMAVGGGLVFAGVRRLHGIGLSLAVSTTSTALLWPLAYGLAALESPGGLFRIPHYLDLGRWDTTILLITVAMFLLLSIAVSWAAALIYQGVRSNPTLERDAQEAARPSP